jgi:hypothetical protein
MPAFSSDERQLLNDSLHDYLSSKYTFDLYRKLSRADGARASAVRRGPSTLPSAGSAWRHPKPSAGQAAA